MSLLGIFEIHNGRAGGDEITSKQMSKATRVRKFRAICSSPYDGPDAVIGGMDPLGTPHPALTNCYLMRRQVDNFEKSKTVFIATATYSTDPIVAAGSPYNDPAEISWNTEQVSRIYQFDQSGNAVLNSANQAFVPGVQDSDAYWVASVKKNVTYVPFWILNFRNAINNAPFVIDNKTVKQYCGWMKNLKIGHIQYRAVGTNQVAFRALEFSIGIKSGAPWGKGTQGALPGVGGAAPAGPTVPILDDWRRYILDEGNMTINGNQAVQGNPNLPNYGQLLPNLNADGTTSRVKVLLDGKGQKLTGNPNPPNNGNPSSAVFIVYTLKTLQNFNQLPLS